MATGRAYRRKQRVRIIKAFLKRRRHWPYWSEENRILHALKDADNPKSWRDWKRPSVRIKRVTMEMWYEDTYEE